MKKICIGLLSGFFIISIHSQVEKVDVPKGVVYNYCEVNVYETAKKMVEKELKETPSYTLTGKMMFIGPVLWKRFKNIQSMAGIEGGNVTFMVDGDPLQGKMTQTVDDSKKVWDELRNDIDGKSFTLRKATSPELAYYWSVISFDIDEPLIIIETKKHRYILNLSPKDYHIVWIDEAP